MSNNVSLFSNNISNCLNSNKMGSAKKPTNGIFGANANNSMFNTGMNQNINPNMMTNQMMTPPKQQTNAFNQQSNQMNTGMQNQGINANIFGNAGLGQNNMMNNNMGSMQSSTPGFNQGTNMMGQAPTTYGTFDYSYSVTNLTEQGQGNNSNVPLKMMAITAMQNYMAKSMEELRYEDYCLKRSGKSVQKSNALVGGTKGNLNAVFNQGANVQAGNLFGGTTNTATTSTTTQGGLFGGTANNNQQQQQGSLFNQQQGSSIGGVFSNPTPTPNTTVSFKQNTTGIFNQPQNTNSNQNQSVFGMNPSTSGMQGGNQQGGGLFGGNTSNQLKPNTGGGLFNSSTNVTSNINNSTSNNNMFGQGGGNLFGNQSKTSNSSTNVTNQAGGLFGNTGTNAITSNTQNTGLSFNNPSQSTNMFSNPTQSGNMFQGTTSQQPSGGLFSQPTQGIQQQNTGLGMKTTTQTGTGGGLFNNTANQSSFFSGNQTTQQSASSGLFGNTGMGNATSSNTNLFGAVNTQSGLFDKSQTTQQGQFPGTQQGLFASPQNIGMMKPYEFAQPMYMNQNPSYINQTLSGNILGLALDSFITKRIIDACSKNKTLDEILSDLKEENKQDLESRVDNILNSSEKYIRDSRSTYTYTSSLKPSVTKQYDFLRTKRKNTENKEVERILQYNRSHLIFLESGKKKRFSEIKAKEEWVRKAEENEYRGSYVSEKKNKVEDQARALKLIINLMAADKKDEDSHMFEILVNPINTVDLLKDTIVDKLREIKKFKTLTKNKFTIFHKADILLDSKELSYYELKNGDHLYIAIDSDVMPEPERKRRRLSHHDLANIDMIPVLSKPGYQTKPAYPLICRMTADQLKEVKGFEIYNSYGRIKFLEKVDLRGLNLDKIVRIEKCSVAVYEGCVKPAKGHGLNVTCEICLYDVQSKEELSQSEKEEFEERLQRAILAKGAKMVNYDDKENTLIITTNELNQL
jgi:hypothetical protein